MGSGEELLALFLSTFTNKVDRKGRVSVPAPFRAVLSGAGFSAVVVFRSFRLPAIEAVDPARMEQLSASADRLEQFSEMHDDLVASIFADAIQLPFDGEGRIMLPRPFAAHAGITDQAAFVGRGRSFQIWEPAACRRHQDQSRARAREQGATLPLRTPPEGTER